MKGHATSDYAGAIHTALFALATTPRNEIIKANEHGFRLMDHINRGLVNPDGLTDAGREKLDALAAAVKVDAPSSAAASAAKSK